MHSQAHIIIHSEKWRAWENDDWVTKEKEQNINSTGVALWHRYKRVKSKYIIIIFNMHIERLRRSQAHNGRSSIKSNTNTPIYL